MMNNSHALAIMIGASFETIFVLMLIPKYPQNIKSDAVDTYQTNQYLSHPNHAYLSLQVAGL